MATPNRPDIRTLHLWQIQPVRDVLVIAAIIGIIYLGDLLRTVTIPMLLALTLAYLFEPVVRKLARAKLTPTRSIPRPLASGIVAVVILLTIAGPIIIGGAFATVQGISYVGRFLEQSSKLQALAQNPADTAMLEALPEGGWRRLGELIRNIELGQDAKPLAPDTKAEPKPDTKPEPAKEPAKETPAPPSIHSATPPSIAPTTTPEHETPAAQDPNHAAPHEASPFERAVAWISAWARDNTGTIGRVTRQVFGTGAEAIGFVARFVKSLVLLAFSAFLTLFFFFFFSSRWGGVQETLTSLIPAQNRQRTLELAGRMDTVIAAFIRGRLIIMAILSVLYVCAYWFIGVPAPLLVGIIVGILSGVPYLPLLGVPISILLMFFMPVGEPHSALYILTVPTLTYWIIQVTDDYFWTPLIQGKATDMDTPTILFAVLSGALLAGFYGVLLAIPIGACFKIFLKEVIVPRFRAWAEGKARDFLPLSAESPADSHNPPTTP